MKSLILLLTTMIVSTAANCQNENTFAPADSAVTWTGRFFNFFSNSTWVEFYTDNNSPDTIIGTDEYTKLYNTYEGYKLAYRADTTTKELFFVPKDSSVEYLFFDYDQTLNLYDTLFIPHYMFPEDLMSVPPSSGLAGAYFELFSIDSSEVNGAFCKRWQFYYLPISDALTDLYNGVAAERIEIMERVICAKSFPFWGEANFETVNELRCYAENDSSIYAANMTQAGTATAECPYNDFISDLNTGDSEKNEIIIYPNPVENELSIQLANPSSATITFFDVTGRKINELFFTNQTKVDLSDYQSGIYYYSVKMGELQFKGKIIKT